MFISFQDAILIGTEDLERHRAAPLIVFLVLVFVRARYGGAGEQHENQGNLEI